MRRYLPLVVILAGFAAGWKLAPAQVVDLPVKAKGKAEDNLNKPDAKERKKQQELERIENMPKVQVVNPVHPKLTSMQVLEPVLSFDIAAPKGRKSLTMV